MKNFKNVYFIGGGIGALTGACFLIRDLGFEGKNIHIIEELKVLGGSNDGTGNSTYGYLMRGGRMWNKSTYENTWDIFDSIPSIYQKEKSLKQEIFDFDDENPTHAMARLYHTGGKIVQDNYLFKFDKNDKKKMFNLISGDEKRFEGIKINEYFDPHFFTSNFWYMFSTTFAFNPWHSVLEMRRYIRRFLHCLDGLYDLSAVARTPYNQYDSVTLPIKSYLDKFGVDFSLKCKVTDISFKESEKIIVDALEIEKDGKEDEIKVDEDDAVIFTNGSMTDTYSWGSLNKAPGEYTKVGSCFGLWRKIVEKRDEFGNPSAFMDNVKESAWGSMTVTFKNRLFFDTMEKWSGNSDGTGALVTCIDSKWLASLVLAKQPHFINQDPNVTVAYGVCYRPYEIGTYIKKPFYECTGKEVMEEFLYHLGFDNKNEIMDSIIDCNPLFTPRGIAQFMVRNGNDRPQVVPTNSVNFALIGQFCEMKDDIVFTEEYSVRSAREAIYKLFEYDGKVKPIKKRYKCPIVLIKAGLITSRKK